VRVYISNGEMGRMWQGRNCDGCVKDHGWHKDEDAAGMCPVLNALLLHEYPIEGLILHEDKAWPDELECTYREPCECA
jgi:hypothetical protein